MDLIGWPADTAFNPHKLSSKALMRCLEALRTNPPSCYWIKLTEAEVAERAAEHRKVTPKTRKPRSDKGKKRGPSSRKRRRMSSSDESGEDGEGKENEPPSNLSPETVDSELDT